MVLHDLHRSLLQLHSRSFISMPNSLLFENSGRFFSLKHTFLIYSHVHDSFSDTSKYDIGIEKKVPSRGTGTKLLFPWGTAYLPGTGNANWYRPTSLLSPWHRVNGSYKVWALVGNVTVQDVTLSSLSEVQS